MLCTVMSDCSNGARAVLHCLGQGWGEQEQGMRQEHGQGRTAAQENRGS